MALEISICMGEGWGEGRLGSQAVERRERGQRRGKGSWGGGREGRRGGAGGGGRTGEGKRAEWDGG